MHERLSPVEAIMWRAGQDPGLRMIVGNLIILDHVPPPEAAAIAPRRSRPRNSTSCAAVLTI